MSVLANITSRHLQYEYSSHLKLLHIWKISNHLREYSVCSRASPYFTFLSVGSLLSITKLNVKLTDSPSEFTNPPSTTTVSVECHVSPIPPSTTLFVGESRFTKMWSCVLKTAIPPLPKCLIQITLEGFIFVRVVCALHHALVLTIRRALVPTRSLGRSP